MSDYDKYELVPDRISNVVSRKDVNMNSPLGFYPFISSPMPGISGSELVIEMGKNNCLGILHRFSSYENRKSEITLISDAQIEFGVAIGINNFDKELEIAKYAVGNGARFICVDIANGYIKTLGEIGNKLINTFEDSITLIAGNVVSYNGAKFLHKSGFDMIRIGIGSGSHCTTRDETGIGRNQIEALLDCTDMNSRGAHLISDGGINIPGSAIKSFVAGANYVMLGGILAYAFEAEDKEGNVYGAASLRNHLNMGKEIKSIEGKQSKIPDEEKMPLKAILDKFIWGTRSACTYLNCSSYLELKYSNSLEKKDKYG